VFNSRVGSRRAFFCAPKQKSHKKVCARPSLFPLVPTSWLNPRSFSVPYLSLKRCGPPPPPVCIPVPWEDEAAPDDALRLLLLSRSSSLRRLEMSCVKFRDVAGSNCSTSVKGFFSPGIGWNSNASWYILRLSLTTRYTCFRSTIFFVHLCTTNPRSSTFTLTMNSFCTNTRRGYFFVLKARRKASACACWFL
jgi:hypothetical protein